MEKKLTDEEIVKALVHCYVKRGRCDDCVLYEDDEKCLAPIAVLDLIQRQKAEIERLTEERENLNWYKMWHNKFKKEIEDLTLELETYRPTKLSGNGQCKCSKCGVVSWTDWFSRYKGQTLCNDCLKKNYGVEVE